MRANIAEHVKMCLVYQSVKIERDKTLESGSKFSWFCFAVRYDLVDIDVYNKDACKPS